MTDEEVEKYEISLLIVFNITKLTGPNAQKGRCLIQDTASQASSNPLSGLQEETNSVCRRASGTGQTTFHICPAPIAPTFHCRFESQKILWQDRRTRSCLNQSPTTVRYILKRCKVRTLLILWKMYHWPILWSLFFVHNPSFAWNIHQINADHR